MDNAGRMERVRTLIADISSAQLDALSHQENFKAVSNTAYGNLQDYLKSRNMKTTDDLVKDIIRTMPAAEQQKILDHLKELEPKQGLEFFLQPSELAKFIFYSYLISGTITAVTPYFYKAKAWFIGYRADAIAKSTLVGGQALTEEGLALQKLTQAERTALLESLEVERVELQTVLEKIAQVELGDVAFIGGAEMGKEFAQVEKAIAAIENIEATEAKALAAATKITVWTKVIIVVSVLAIIGIAVYDKVKENQIRDELRETIKQVATARLYVRMNERIELTHTDQMGTIQMLAAALKDGNKDVVEFLQKNFADTIDKALKTIDEDSTYQMLKAKDADRKNDTSEDPSLDDMKKERAKQAKK